MLGLLKLANRVLLCYTVFTMSFIRILVIAVIPQNFPEPSGTDFVPAGDFGDPLIPLA